MSPRCHLVAPILLLAATLPAQHPITPFATVPSTVLAPTILVDGSDLWGVGEGFKVRFDGAAIEFHARFGPAAPRNFPLHYQLAELGRGSTWQHVDRAERRQAGLRVEYARGPVVERYDVRTEGLEQSFLLHELPPGTGDLIVRGHVHTDLQVAADGTGLRFQLPDVGSFTLGGVTAIDANGRRAAGTVHWHDGRLDYRVPAEFLADAQLPLIVDPLLGGTTVVAQGATVDQDPDVAFDATNGVYLVVFEYLYSATDTDIYGQRIGTDGSAVGGRIAINTAAANDLNPQVANVNLRDRFVVVYNRQGAGDSDVYASSVAAATGTASLAYPIATGTDDQGTADVGGEATLADSDAITVWDNATQDRIEAAQIGVNVDGSVFVQDVTTISATDVLRPRISKSGGNTGIHMIVWQRAYGIGDYDPFGAAFDRELTRRSPDTPFDTAINFTTGVDVDGDGTAWVAAWQAKESSTAQHDIMARAMHVRPTSGVSSLVFGSAIMPVETVPAEDSVDPAVVWLGESALVAYDIRGAGNWCYLRSVDTGSCTDCEGRIRVLVSLSDDHAIAGASRRSGGDAVDEALFAVERWSGAERDVLARRFQGADGRVLSVQPGCGNDGGLAFASCPRPGNGSFAIRCHGAAPSASALLVLSRSTGLFVCGSCRLLPDPYAGYVHATTTDGTGAAAFATAIPALASLAGLNLWAQWVVIEPISPGCYPFAADLSDAVRVTIE